MDDENCKVSRRFLLRAAALLGAGALTASLGVQRQALAQQKVSKQAMKYQDKPNGAQQCSNCMHFLPNNQCAVVEGAVSPQGWCIAWAKKA